LVEGGSLTYGGVNIINDRHNIYLKTSRGNVLLNNNAFLKSYHRNIASILTFLEHSKNFKVNFSNRLRKNQTGDVYVNLHGWKNQPDGYNSKVINLSNDKFTCDDDSQYSGCATDSPGCNGSKFGYNGFGYVFLYKDFDNSDQFLNGDDKVLFDDANTNTTSHAHGCGVEIKIPTFRTKSNQHVKFEIGFGYAYTVIGMDENGRNPFLLYDFTDTSAQDFSETDKLVLYTKRYDGTIPKNSNLHWYITGYPWESVVFLDSNKNVTDWRATASGSEVSLKIIDDGEM
jgi:hypothetical protein